MNLKQKIEIHKVILVVLFLLAISLQIFFAFQTDTFSSDESYFHIRQVEHITENVSPLIFDDLSYGGKYIYSPHLFHLFLAIFVFLFGSIAFKIIPPLMVGSLIFVVYGIANRVSENKNAALFSASIVAFLPIFLNTTLNQISIKPFSILFVFLLLFFLVDIKKYINWFIAFSIILPLIDPMNFLFMLALILYLILSKVETFRLSRLAKEAILFNILITIFLNLLQFSYVFYNHGIKAVYENIPTSSLVTYFQNLDVFLVLAGVGILVILLGVFGFTFGFLRENKPAIYLLSSVIITEIILLLLKLSSFVEGLFYLGIAFTIMASLSFLFLENYLNITKFVKIKSLIILVFVIIVLGSVIVPAYITANQIVEESVTADELAGFIWLNENTLNDSVILANIDEGHKITALAERKNVIDTNYLYSENRYDDVTLVFKTISQIKARFVLDKYGVDYFYVSKRALDSYGLENLNYIDDTCFNKEFENEEVQIYKYTC